MLNPDFTDGNDEEILNNFLKSANDFRYNYQLINNLIKKEYFNNEDLHALDNVLDGVEKELQELKKETELKQATCEHDFKHYKTKSSQYGRGKTFGPNTETIIREIVKIGLCSKCGQEIEEVIKKEIMKAFSSTWEEVPVDGKIKIKRQD